MMPALCGTRKFCGKLRTAGSEFRDDRGFARRAEGTGPAFGGGGTQIPFVVLSSTGRGIGEIHEERGDPGQCEHSGDGGGGSELLYRVQGFHFVSFRSG